MAALEAHFAPVLPRPFVIEDLCLFGEDDGGFHLLHRYALTG
ncbi:MAG: phosphonate metabolism protein, partial [Rhodobacterales bacterium]